MLSNRSADGHFDILYTDGFVEKKVSRQRIHLRYPPVESKQRIPLNCEISRGIDRGESSSSPVNNTSSRQMSNSSTSANVIIQPRSVLDYDNYVIGKDPSWRLVYAGPDCHYACEGLVPVDVLEKEPNTEVSVVFRLQTLGTEIPRTDCSLPSFGACFWTVNKCGDQSQDDSIESKRNTGNHFSRPRKELFAAVLESKRVIQLERNYHTIISQGASDHYI